jgi:hypothetical protein
MAAAEAAQVPLVAAVAVRCRLVDLEIRHFHAVRRGVHIWVFWTLPALHLVQPEVVMLATILIL